VPHPPVESLPALLEHVSSLMDAESDDRPRPQIADVRRMGRSTGSVNAKPRHVVVSFARKTDKSRGRKLNAVLCAKNIKLARNLTPVQQTAKKRLQPSANLLYSEGKKPFWREAKLWYWQEGRSFPRLLLPPPPRGAARTVPEQAAMHAEYHCSRRDMPQNGPCLLGHLLVAGNYAAVLLTRRRQRPKTTPPDQTPSSQLEHVALRWRHSMLPALRGGTAGGMLILRVLIAPCKRSPARRRSWALVAV